MGISIPSIRHASLSWGRPIYDCPIGSSRQPRQTEEVPSVPRPPALPTQPPGPHHCAPGALLNKVPDPSSDIPSVLSHQPPSWSSSPGPAPYSRSSLTTSRRTLPTTVSGLSLPRSKSFQQSPPSKTWSRCIAPCSRLWQVSPTKQLSLLDQTHHT